MLRDGLNIMAIEYNHDKYEAYITSAKWLIRKSKFVTSLLKKKKPIECMDCQGQTHLQVHHLHYRNLFDEKDEDLVLLCKRCHGYRHGISSKEEDKKWAEVVEELREIFGGAKKK